MWRVRKRNKNFHTQLKNITQELLGKGENDPKSHIYIHNDHKIRQ